MGVVTYRVVWYNQQKLLSKVDGSVWMKEKILAMLGQGKHYVSGQEMCRELGVSRTAVWNVLSELKEYGYALEAVSNRGSALVSCLHYMTVH